MQGCYAFAKVYQNTLVSHKGYKALMRQTNSDTSQ